MAPPPEWGVTKTFAKWTVHRVCESGLDLLNVEAAPEAGAAGGFAFQCSKEFGVSGLLVLSKIQLDGPVSLLTLKGSAAPAVPLDGYGAGGTTGLNLEESPATSRFMAALVDGPGPTFTLVITPPGRPPLEMTLSRTGLAAAVKPLRRECAW
jgi:hypothetical protein